MADFVFPLPLALDVQSLTMSLVNIASPPGQERDLADSIEAALRSAAHLDVTRAGESVVARTNTGSDRRVVIAGQLDVASEDEPLAYVEMGKLFGPGACAKGALAVMLKAAIVGRYHCDVTFLYRAGLGKWPKSDSADGDALRSDFLLLAEPTNSVVRGATPNHPTAERLTALTDDAPVSDAVVPQKIADLGWPDVPGGAFGPGDPSVAGNPGEFVPTAQLTQCEFVLRQWLTT